MGDPSLKSTWAHRAWLTCGCITVLISLVNAIIGSINSCTWLQFQTILAGFMGYLLADLGTGVYHWAIDNYGNTSTPVFGWQIDAFQRHHNRPSALTKIDLARLLHEIARATTIIVLPIDFIWHDRPVVMGFVAMASGCLMFGPQFHCWAHVSKGKLPTLVVALQDAGVLISQSKHSIHHQPPHNNSYCSVSGLWNRFLDEYRVFQTLEMMIYVMSGLKARSWSEPNTDKMVVF